MIESQISLDSSNLKISIKWNWIPNLFEIRFNAGLSYVKMYI